MLFFSPGEENILERENSFTKTWVFLAHFRVMRGFMWLECRGQRGREGNASSAGSGKIKIKEIGKCLRSLGVF